jgi:hypothetical protein
MDNVYHKRKLKTLNKTKNYKTNVHKIVVKGEKWGDC